MPSLLQNTNLGQNCNSITLEFDSVNQFYACETDAMCDHDSLSVFKLFIFQKKQMGPPL